jgi:hypothetical protein
VKVETNPVTEMLCLFEYQQMEKAQTPSDTESLDIMITILGKYYIEKIEICFEDVN